MTELDPRGAPGAQNQQTSFSAATDGCQRETSVPSWDSPAGGAKRGSVHLGVESARLDRFQRNAPDGPVQDASLPKGYDAKFGVAGHGSESGGLRRELDGPGSIARYL